MGADRRGDEVTPTFTHTTTLAPAKTSTVQWAAGETRRKTVSKLVDDDASLEIPIPVRLDDRIEKPLTKMMSKRYLL